MTLKGTVQQMNSIQDSKRKVRKKNTGKMNEDISSVNEKVSSIEENKS